MAKDTGPTSGGDALTYGVAIMVLAGIALGIGISEDLGWLTFVAYAALAAGGLIAQIGVIAIGVSMGLRRADWLRSR